MDTEFLLDETNIRLKEVYEDNDNYFVKEIGNSNICYIFCSSNGIYYPNTYEEFEKKIINEDRFEWENISKASNIVNNAGRMIYVRDVYKQHYVKGINSTIDSIDKLCDMLRKLSDGMKVITVGTSSGGYLATILGRYLNAECVFNFAGQWSLYNTKNKSYFIEKYKNIQSYNKYYNIAYMNDNIVPIMYFYSALNKNDSEQVNMINRNASNIYCFAMKSADHGFMLLPGCYINLLTSKVDKLIMLCKRYDGKIISMRKMCFNIMDSKSAVRECLKDIIRCHKSLWWINKFLKK